MLYNNASARGNDKNYLYVSKYEQKNQKLSYCSAIFYTQKLPIIKYWSV